MDRDHELAALIEQAGRNLRTLRLLIMSTEPPLVELDRLQQQFEQLKRAYVEETDSLTRQVLRRAVERRSGVDRRKELDLESIGT